LSRILRDNFVSEGYEVAVRYERRVAVAEGEGIRSDLILLDLGLPGSNGFDLCSVAARPAFARRS